MNFILSIYKDRRILFNLVSNDLKSRYLTNYLGFLWAFIQPCATALTLWLVFEFGFKAAPQSDVPFILWLICGLIPWFFIVEGLSTGCSAIRDNSFLVKKIVFKVSLLPVVKIGSALIVHVFFVLILCLLFMLYGFKPNLYWLQLGYYITCTVLLLLALAWLTSSIVVFFSDLTQIVAMLVQFGFWLTPVFWNIDTLSGTFVSVLKLNPFCYIVEGYRDSMIEQVWFWERPTQMLVFWSGLLLLLICSMVVFKRLRPHFADVL
ncbi:ABC transporter permease [Motilimonas cestriensis]|uniref:ABC transporter permease n=1 Tax=Motilimonas cestriensis TaxID=2742685 RepID=UPI003DA48B73